MEEEISKLEKFIKFFKLLTFMVFVLSIAFGGYLLWSIKIKNEANTKIIEVDNKIIKDKNMQEFMDNLEENVLYYFINKETRTYGTLKIKKNRDAYVLEKKENIDLLTHPIEYDKQRKSKHACEDKVVLYDRVVKFYDKFKSNGYVEQHILNFLEFPDNEKIYDPSVEELFKSYRVEDRNGKITRYDLYAQLIRVNEERVKNKNKMINEVLYTLYYTSKQEVLDAMVKTMEILKEKKIIEYNSVNELIKEFKKYSKTANKDEPREASIVFEHLIDNKTFYNKELSGLKHTLPQTAKKFDFNDIEEGRIYFWIPKETNNLLSSKAIYFVLQNRERNDYFSDKLKQLGNFNKKYYEDTYFSNSYLIEDSMESKVKGIEKKGWIEVSMEEVLEALTKKKSETVLAQVNQTSVFMQKDAFDLYENMIQHWHWDENIDDMFSHTYFFDTEEKRDSWLKDELAQQKEYDYEKRKKIEVQEKLDFFSKIHKTNEDYKLQRIVKEKLLKEYPDLKKKLSSSDFKKFMKYSPLKIIEGDHEVNSSVMLDADETSLLITGDLKVNGTLMYKSKDSLKNDNFIIVLGDVVVENYVHEPRFDLIFYANNLEAKNIIYLPAGSRSWYIEVKGEVKTNILLHATDKKIEDKKIIFNKEYSTKVKSIFVDGFFNESAYEDKLFMFNQLKDNKPLLKTEMLDEKKISDELILVLFKRKLEYWHSLYYSFAGFRDMEVEGKYYGHYIESDLLLKDEREGTGFYLMSHDDMSLEQIKVEKEHTKDGLSSEKLAYRFFWIMWTFSDWKTRFDGPMDYWKSIEQIDKTYQNGKAYFKDDPHLALYWIMHFGLLEDPRILEMKELMQDSEHELIQGAFLFFEELEKTKNYSIKIDYKENNTIFNERMLSHKAQIKKASVSKDDKVLFILSQFKEQPNSILELLNEIHSEHEGEADKVLTYLENHPYEVGFSFLHIMMSKEKDKSKWYRLFLTECETHEHHWKSNHLLVEMIGIFYTELEYEDSSMACAIVSSKSHRPKISQAIVRHHQTLFVPDDLTRLFEHRTIHLKKENFSFQTFLDKTFDIAEDKRMDFIRVCIKHDLFTQKVTQESMSPYLLLWYIADDDFYPLKKALKQLHAKEIIEHYALSREDFDEQYKEMSKGERNGFFLKIKRYFE